MPRLERDGVAIHYEVVGSGAPVLLHHGLSDSLVTWKRTGWVDRLAERYRVILVDARGHGESDKPHAPEAYGSEPMVRDLLALLDTLGEEAVHFVGYSMGGRMGFELACAAPARLRSLAAGAAHPYAESLAHTRDAIGAGAAPWLERVAAREGPLAAMVRAHYLTNDLEALAACTAADRPDRSEVLARFARPALLFVGSEDPAAERVMRAAFALPKGHLVLFPGYDHVGLGLRMDLVLPAIETFLEAADRADEPARYGMA